MQQLQRILITGLFILRICNSVILMPNNMDIMQNDDYDYYSDDQSAPNQNSKPTDTTGLQTYLTKPKAMVRGQVGQDITMQCESKISKDEVVLWYKDQLLISTGKSIVSPMYSLDPNTYALTIINASPSSGGDYHCELLPQKIQMHTKVVVSEKTDVNEQPPLEVNDSSHSSQVSLRSCASIWLAFILPFAFKYVLRVHV